MKTFALALILSMGSFLAFAEDAPHVAVTASEDGATVTVSVTMPKPSVKGSKAAIQSCVERAIQLLQGARVANSKTDAELKAELDKRLKDVGKARPTTNLKDEK